MTARLNRLSRLASSLLLASTMFACEATDADVPTRPVVVFPAWSAGHDQQATVRVTPAAGWSIARVEYSLDGSEWLQATGPSADAAAGSSADGTPYTVALSGLDIGANEFTLRVTSTYRGQTQVDYFYSMIPSVAAEFNCTTAALSMLPSATMIRNVGTEQRTMIGYFGNPDGGHTLTFVVGFTNLLQDHYDIVGSNVQVGSDAITASFDVSDASCDDGTNQDPHDCDTPYSLTVLVDGVQLCRQEAFGQIHWYRGGPP